MTLRGKVAVVTGAASGMGRALCRELAQEGACLGLLDRDGEGLASLDKELREQGAYCCQAVADVSDRQAVRSAMNAEHGPGGATAPQRGRVHALLMSFEASLSALRSPGDYGI